MSTTSPASVVSAVTPPAPAVRPSRDLRLDFFRGLALWFIFIDHVPSNSIANLTYRNFGFSDATEIFVFISGYTAALVYGLDYDRRGFAYMALHVLRRCWQLYAAHIVLFTIFVAQVTWAAHRFDNPVYIEELNVGEFLDDPGQTLLRALLLDYRPVNLDVLPLYIALLLAFPPVLFIARRSLTAIALLSGLLYVAVQQWKGTLPVYESGNTWVFNPLGWQALFVAGVVCAVLNDRGRTIPWNRAAGIVCAVYLAFALVVALSWKMPMLDELISPWLENLLYPIDKTNLDVARIAHFLAVAYLTAHLIGPDSPLLRWRLARPVIVCGQHSLYVFCLGIALSFVAYFVLVQSGGSLPMQLLVSLGGLAIMSLQAYLMGWHKRRGAQRTAAGGASG
ncbi:MAG TPA: OpgC domain-containing protein [Burkholderiaceae bacterium]|nr:OpgC domain-containing protein [Burkholderiaceae bacterium]